MFGVENSGSALDEIAHVIQVALTPVFLLSGIATLLNVFSTRLARVADQVQAVGKALQDADRAEKQALSDQLARLRRRSVALDIAVVLAGIGGASTCAAVLALFVGALRDVTIGSVLFGLFGSRRRLRACSHRGFHLRDADCWHRHSRRGGAAAAVGGG
jgi:hypothetical protein